MDEQKATVKIHNAKEIPSEVLWTGHALTGVLALLAIAIIFFAKGPRRAEALESLVKSSKK